MAIKQTKSDKKVEVWTHERAGLETTVYLSGTQFYANLLERDFRAPDIALLRKQLRDYAEVQISLEWYPILEVSTEAERGYRSTEGVSITFKFERYFLGRSNGGEVFQVDWETDPEHRKAKMSSISDGRYGRHSSHDRELKLTKLPLGAPFKKQAGEYLIDYDEDLWEACERIEKGIEAINGQILALFATKQGLAMLLSGVGSNALLLGDAKPTKTVRRR